MEQELLDKTSDTETLSQRIIFTEGESLFSASTQESGRVINESPNTESVYLCGAST
jgi:hypothetical protein